MRSLTAFLFACLVATAYAGGPRFVAGTSYFDPALEGMPVLWASGQVIYFIDQGDLSATVNHATAAATVAAAAATWNVVPTAAVLLASGGALAENVSGANVVPGVSGITMPADIQSGAVATPVGVVFDSDGSVIDAFYGVDASDPDDCIDTGAIAMVDNLTASGTIAHALILVNGRCTGTSAQLQQIQFQLIRAFGRALGLDWSQANDGILTGPGTPSYQQLQGWPVMRPVDLDCNQLSIQCIPDPTRLRPDDVASISRLYPVTPANLAQFPGKTVTASATVSIHGTVSFLSGQGMQGVNVVARPITPGVGLADDRYPASSVSGFLFTGNQGGPIDGAVSLFGTTNAATEGFYDITGIVLPPGETQADFQLTLELVNPLYTGSQSVGPYTLGSPSPSGTMPTITIRGLSAGQSVEQDFTIADSANDLQAGSGGSAIAPAAIPTAGEWQSRVPGPGHAAWFAIPAQGGRHFTIETEALGQAFEATEDKLRPILGVWNVLDPATNLPVNATVAPFNGAAVGVTALAVDTIADGQLLLGVADQRGDGRPDYAFHGRLLYAANVSPARLPLAGGQITIHGSGFHPSLTLFIGSQIRASVIEVTPTTLVAVAPASAVFTGSLDLIVVDPVTNGIAAIAGGISYGDALTDTMSITTALPSTVAQDTSNTFTVRVFAPDQLTPIGGVPVYFSVLAGSVAFGGCSTSTCSVTTTGDGYATIQATPLAPGQTKLQAALSNGTALEAEFTAVATPAIAAVSSPLFLAPGATWSWAPQVEVWNGAVPAADRIVNWSAQGAMAAFPAFSLTNAQGIATLPVNLGPWSAGQTFTVTGCLAESTSCAAISAYTVHPEAESLTPVSGTEQQLLPGQIIAPLVLRLIAPGGQPIVGGIVTVSGWIRAWTPPCPVQQICVPGRLLAPIALSGTSTVDGSVSLLLNASDQIPELLSGVASAGSSSSVPFEVTIHP